MAHLSVVLVTLNDDYDDMADVEKLTERLDCGPPATVVVGFVNNCLSLWFCSAILSTDVVTFAVERR